MSEQSESVGALAKALAFAQSQLEDAKKDAVNPHFKNRYATLASVRAAVTPVLSRNGLAVVQTNEPHGDAGVCVITTLMHESGEWIRGRLFVPVVKKDPQGFGSALSYARRYALAEIAGIASDDDDDAEVATHSGSLERQLHRSVESNWGAWVQKWADAMRVAARQSPGSLAESWADCSKDAKRLNVPSDFLQKATAVKDALKQQRVTTQAAQ